MPVRLDLMPKTFYHFHDFAKMFLVLLSLSGKQNFFMFHVFSRELYHIDIFSKRTFCDQFFASNFLDCTFFAKVNIFADILRKFEKIVYFCKKN